MNTIYITRAALAMIQERSQSLEPARPLGDDLYAIDVDDDVFRWLEEHKQAPRDTFSNVIIREMQRSHT